MLFISMYSFGSCSYMNNPFSAESKPGARQIQMNVAALPIQQAILEPNSVLNASAQNPRHFKTHTPIALKEKRPPRECPNSQTESGILCETPLPDKQISPASYESYHEKMLGILRMGNIKALSAIYSRTVPEISGNSLLTLDLTLSASVHLQSNAPLHATTESISSMRKQLQNQKVKEFEELVLPDSFKILGRNT
eukprot:TRINITY_DN2734_c0_g1_i2.p1 TRINITY_DN2734_c0_g1~~TRINITY_DN2734_c0_g1_i2.p1  ORF type:complete len:195 (-),score=8.28 TRINITY_DN2734_c0_g1_i2:474-1058(-)